jgi:hypothetical protein
MRLRDAIRELVVVRDCDRFERGTPDFMYRMHYHRVRAHRAGEMGDDGLVVTRIRDRIRNLDRPELLVWLNRHRLERINRAIGFPRRYIIGDQARDDHVSRNRIGRRRGLRTRYCKYGERDRHRPSEYSHTKRIPAPRIYRKHLGSFDYQRHLLDLHQLWRVARANEPIDSRIAGPFV